MVTTMACPGHHAQVVGGGLVSHPLGPPPTPALACGGSQHEERQVRAKDARRRVLSHLLQTRFRLEMDTDDSKRLR